MERLWIGDESPQDLAAQKKAGSIPSLYGVIAGTPVDTRMGVDELKKRGWSAIGLSASPTPHDQARMQIMAPKELTEHVLGLIQELENLGADGIWIYCNSMSGSVDLAYLREKASVPVITPLDVYQKLASQYHIIGVIAANGQSLAGIERALQAGSPDCWEVGASLMAVVLDIEAAEPPEKIVEKYKLAGLLESMKAMGSEALILGCTHFPYIKKELAALKILPIIDPADQMADLLKNS